MKSNKNCQGNTHNFFFASLQLIYNRLNEYLMKNHFYCFQIPEKAHMDRILFNIFKYQRYTSFTEIARDKREN